VSAAFGLKTAGKAGRFHATVNGLYGCSFGGKYRKIADETNHPS
jgi:hypothetical protein